jgi:hypothetical protein
MSMVLRYWLDDPATHRVCAEIELPLQTGGAITVRACMDAADVAAALRAKGIEVQKVGSIFGDIGSFVHKVVSGGAISKALDIVDTVMPMTTIANQMATSGAGQSFLKSIPAVGPAAAAAAVNARHLTAALTAQGGRHADPSQLTHEAARALAAAKGAAKLMSAAKGTGPKAERAKMLVRVAAKHAELEHAHGHELPPPHVIAAKGKDAVNGYRYMVTVQRAMLS